MIGGQQALDKRMEEVKSREQAVAQAQTALGKAEEMLHDVQISQTFLLGTCEVTNDQFEEVISA